MGQRDIIEEYLANQADLQKLSGFKSFVQKIKLALRKVGFRAKWTVDEIATLMRRSLENVRKQRSPQTGNNNGARFNINLNESINIVSIPPLDIDLKNTAAVRKYLKEHFKGREVTIKSDGKLVLFVDQGLQDALKRKNEHRKSFSALDKIIEDSVFIAYENVDARHSNKRPDLKGQFIYSSLIKIENEIYVATIKLDDTKADSRAHFKDISIKKWSLYVGQTDFQNAVPSADHYLTLQQFIDFVKPENEKNQEKMRFSIAPVIEIEKFEIPESSVG
ncbi:MAG: hypothetical protein IKB71_02605 [Lentisphaeria bacterium]|nr:hypothetical protein [Lentisphaeria bacterium]